MLIWDYFCYDPDDALRLICDMPFLFMINWPQFQYLKYCKDQSQQAQLTQKLNSHSKK